MDICVVIGIESIIMFRYIHHKVRLTSKNIKDFNC